jgi:hypothetical protein
MVLAIRTSGGNKRPGLPRSRLTSPRFDLELTNSERPTGATLRIRSLPSSIAARPIFNPSTIALRSDLRLIASVIPLEQTKVYEIFLESRCSGLSSPA